MIKNTLYSYNYHQPADYRFSLDSVFLAQKVAFSVRETIQPKALSELKVLDLCSGCGVVGLELQFHLPELRKIDFLEVQDVYRSYFEKNCEQINVPNLELSFLNMNYESLLQENFKERYDIIVSNPPYFFLGEGLLSPNNDFKNRCRFFIDSSFQKLIEATLFSLHPKGKAYLLMRPGGHHGRDLVKEMEKLIAGLARVQVFDEVRGTNVVMLTKEI